MLSASLSMKIPARWSNLRLALAAAGSIAVTKKPEADNVLKGDGQVQRDHLADDAQVVCIELNKRYSGKPEAHIDVMAGEGASAQAIVLIGPDHRIAGHK